MLVFGIDTGSLRCGYAVLGMDGHAPLALLECGVFAAPANDNAGNRIRIIADDFRDLMDQYGGGPGDVCAIESAYIPGGHRQGVETLAEARGVLSYVARTRGLSVVTVAPSTVKKAVTGSGRADKDGVAEVVRMRFGLKKALDPNASDAVGVALSAVAK